MKKILSALLAVLTVSALLAACGNEKKQESEVSATSAAAVEEATEPTTPEYPETHTLYFKDSTKSGKATVTFFNSLSGKSENVEMKKTGEDADSVTFSCEGNCALYNMAYITFNNEKTKEFAFNPCVSGWYKTEDDFLPYTEGQEINYTPEFEKITLKGHGYDKNIYIWKPDDYDAESADKYSTVYAIDGQFLTYLRDYGQILKDCAVATDQVKAMNSVTNQESIVVAIDNVGTRDYELSPAFADSVIKKDFESKNGTPYKDEFDCMDGTQFADFVVNTLVPYVQQHYNVYTDKQHTSLVGASMGGLESFYISVEYPEAFGTVGILSPSFWMYESETWDKYLKQKSFDSSYPYLYFYTGSDENDVGAHVNEMLTRLENMKYSKDSMVLHYDENGAHGGMFWRLILSEYLTSWVYGKIEPLQNESK